MRLKKYCVKSRVWVYFGNIFALFVKLQQMEPCIQGRGHRVAPSEATFLPVPDPTLMLVLEVKDPFTEASAFSRLKKCHEHRISVLIQNK